MRIVYISEDGLNVITPAPGIPIEDCIKNVPDGLGYKIVSVSEVPSDRSFRNAWEIQGEKIAVNMTKAVEIQQDRLRVERQPLLESLDVAFMKALEAGDAKMREDIVARKQALRDVTNHPALLLAKTPEELKGVTIETLGI
jgi:hypothetical protein